MSLAIRLEIRALRDRLDKVEAKLERVREAVDFPPNRYGTPLDAVDVDVAHAVRRALED